MYDNHNTFFTSLHSGFMKTEEGETQRAKKNISCIMKIFILAKGEMYIDEGMKEAKKFKDVKGKDGKSHLMAYLNIKEEKLRNFLI